MTKERAVAWLKANGWEILRTWPSGRITIAKGEALYRCESAEKAVEVLQKLLAKLALVRASGFR